MKKTSSDVSQFHFSSNGKNHGHAVLEKKRKDRTEKMLFISLLFSLLLVIAMLLYSLNEWLVVYNASDEYLNEHYDFGPDQAFYQKDAQSYLKFTVRFITIFGLIGLFGLAAIVLRKSWLYLLIVLMALISFAYFMML